jgi:hypothetical protein
LSDYGNDPANWSAALPLPPLSKSPLMVSLADHPANCCKKLVS